MKPYGIKLKDANCCPGHDKYPRETYKNRLSIKQKRRTTKLAHQRARALAKVEILKLLK